MITRKLFEFDEYIGETVAGVDEAGRGSLAGPVFAACVVLPEFIDGINDSKALLPKRRELLDGQIRAKAVFVGVGTASVEEILRLNILNASLLAMKRAAEGAVCDLILVDGKQAFDSDKRMECLPKGDRTSYAVAAASIVAKVARDKYMTELDKLYPEYGFARHKGYGTAEHYAAILRCGASDVHRKHFLRSLQDHA
ncbi:MAG: ribonuclease HII [Oscillospiraceae bacterium]|jgi:ribonuclease HII|nr:ribonuclease HII [Oscillospiraceae bacterium]